MNYEYFTTFWSDFSIAERFGYEAIDDTAERAYEEWKNDVKYLTELVMILNHKCWMYYHDGLRRYQIIIVTCIINTMKRH